MSLFELKEASFSYNDRTVFENLNFCLAESEILAILGHNGVGKTTLIKCCLGILKWKKGKSFLQGKEISHFKPKDLFLKIAYVPQAKTCSINLSVFDMVLLGCNVLVSTCPKKEHCSKVSKILERLNIAHLKNKSCMNLSGGELQMVILARALINDPVLIILDEPESNLDFKNQDCILNALLELKNSGKAIIINTHFPQNAYKLADKILIMQDKKFTLGGKELINKTQLSQSFDVSTSFFDYLNIS